MTVIALVIRRFNVKTDGTASLAELARVLELPMAPSPGLLLAFDDGSEAPVSFIRVRASHPQELGFRPPGVELRTKTEPGERYEAALNAGWAPLPAVQAPAER